MSVHTVVNWFPEQLASLNPVGSRTGVAAGAFAQIRAGDLVSLWFELDYIEKGMSGAKGLKLGYLEVPVLVRVNLDRARALPFFVGGPAFAKRLTCYESLPASPGLLGKCAPTRPNDAAEIPHPLSQRDVSGILGIGLERTFGSRTFVAQLRFARSLSSIATSGTVDPSVGAGRFQPRNQGYTLLLGTNF